MVKVIGPALSLGAAGTVGKTLTYQERPSGAVTYLYKKPGSRGPFVFTPAQNNQKVIIGGLVAQWKALSGTVKAVWDAAAKNFGYIGTGYHFFIHSGGALSSTLSWSDPNVAWSDPAVSWSGFLV